MIFVDTSFWVAFVNRRDARHGEALAIMRRFADRALVTTNHVRGETWTFLRRRGGHRVATGFLDLTERSARLEVAFVAEREEEDALQWLRRHDEREYSFVDATSFSVMRARRIGRAFAFDGDFSAAGFEQIRGP